MTNTPMEGFMEVGTYRTGLSIWDPDYVEDSSQRSPDAELTTYASPYEGILYKWERYQIIEITEPAWNNPNTTVTNKYVVPVHSNDNHLRTYLPVPKGWKASYRHENYPAISTVEIDFDDILKLAENLDDNDTVIEFYETYGSLGMILHNVQTISNTDRLTTVTTGWTADNIPPPL